jgi:hypothetical protein
MDIDKKLRDEWVARFFAIMDVTQLDWKVISGYRFITIETILKYEDQPWDWYHLAYYAHVTIDDVLRCPKLQIWSNLSYNNNITIEQIFEHPTYEWNWKHIFANRKFTLEFIEKYEMYMQWDALSKNYHLTTDIIYKYINKQWNLSELSKNTACIQNGIVEQFPDWNWNWNEISSNYSITLDFIEKHKHKPLNWEVLRRWHHFNYECDTFIEHTQTKLSIAMMCEYYQHADNYAKCGKTICAKDMVFSNEYVMRCVLRY